MQKMLLPWEIYEFFRSSHGRYFMKKAVLKNFVMFTGKFQTWNFIKKRFQKEIQFSLEYCEIFKNSYFEDHLLTAASYFLKQLQNTDRWAAAS